VYGYHGTSGTAAELILRDGFLPSQRPYDLLRDGGYFWEEAQCRALEWATATHGSDAAVIEAVLVLDD